MDNFVDVVFTEITNRKIHIFAYQANSGYILHGNTDEQTSAPLSNLVNNCNDAQRIYKNNIHSVIPHYRCKTVENMFITNHRFNEVAACHLCAKTAKLYSISFKGDLINHLMCEDCIRRGFKFVQKIDTFQEPFSVIFTIRDHAILYVRFQCAIICKIESLDKYIAEKTIQKYTDNNPPTQNCLFDGNATTHTHICANCQEILHQHKRWRFQQYMLIAEITQTYDTTNLIFAQILKQQ